MENGKRKHAALWRKRQATSDKRQATSDKRQATSDKRDQDLASPKEIQPVQRETQPGSPKRLSLSSGKSKHRNMDKHAP